MASPACRGICGLGPVSGRSKTFWIPPKGAKQGLCYQIWVSKMWWPAPSSLSLLLNPKGLLGLEANVLKVDLCSCHATRAHIMGTKICWIGLVCSFLSLATDETPWSYSKLMLASRWAYCIEFCRSTFELPRNWPSPSFICVLAVVFLPALFLKTTLERPSCDFYF